MSCTTSYLARMTTAKLPATTARRKAGVTVYSIGASDRNALSRRREKQLYSALSVPTIVSVRRYA
jgi:hypothetical protein